MDPMDPDKLAHFKALIGFDLLPRSRAGGPYPAVAWPDPLQAPGVHGEGWTIAADTPWREAQGSAREWVLRRGPETLVVLAFVSSAGETGARDFLLARACNTMTLEVPYVAGPQDLGSLAVQSPNSSAPYLMWVSGNCCIELKAFATALDLQAIARWLQSHLEAAALPRGARPPDRVRMSALQARVGEVLQLRLEPGESAPPAGYLMELEYDRDEIEVVSQDGLAASLRGRRAGTARLTVHGVDLATLASSDQSVELNFAAPE